jgi:hypothetical protein
MRALIPESGYSPGMKDKRCLAVAAGGFALLTLFFSPWFVVVHEGDADCKPSGWNIAMNNRDSALIVRYGEIAMRSAMRVRNAGDEAPPDMALRVRPRRNAVPELLLVPALALTLLVWGIARFRAPSARLPKEALGLAAASAAVSLLVIVLALAWWRQGGIEALKVPLSDPFGTLRGTPSDIDLHMEQYRRERMTVSRSVAFWVTLVFLGTSTAFLVQLRRPVKS